jgi:precorrin-6A/cobalt-precorrin-6A reductase
MVERLLILGGTTEAAALARRAVAAFDDRLQVTTSLAGRLAPPRGLAGRVRIGGFGGVAGLLEALRELRIDLVVDATHPFAAVISANAADACAQAGVPRLMLIRPPWRPEPGDRWLEVDSLATAAEALPGLARRAFLTVGSGGIDAFRAVAGVWFLVRLFEPPARSLPRTDFRVVIDRPPFTVEGERALFAEHRIDTLVSKQSGGPTDAKLAAARETGARVVMVRRPAAPAGERVETVDGALAWIGRRIHTNLR